MFSDERIDATLHRLAGWALVVVLAVVVLHMGVPLLAHLWEGWPV